MQRRTRHRIETTGVEIAWSHCLQEVSTMSTTSEMNRAQHAPARDHWNWTGSRRGIYRSLAAAVAGLVGALAAEVAARRAIRDLARMSEHRLRDLGLSRGDVERVV